MARRVVACCGSHRFGPARLGRQVIIQRSFFDDESCAAPAFVAPAAPEPEPTPEPIKIAPALVLRPIYETAEDEERQKRVMAILEQRWACHASPQPKFSPFDCSLSKIFNGPISALVEIKCRENAREYYPTYMISAAKITANYSLGTVNASSRFPNCSMDGCLGVCRHNAASPGRREHVPHGRANRSGASKGYRNNDVFQD